MSRPLLREYAAAGFVLVPIPQGLKGPVAKDWNKREMCISDLDVAEHMDGNVGLAHAYSGTCCIDIDDMQPATEWLSARGIDIQTFINDPTAVRIDSGREGRAKLLYRLKRPLPSFKLSGFELRCAARSGLTVQDVLPPSIHPVTGKPYAWAYGDELTGHWSNLPPLPDAILKVWQALITPSTKIEQPKTRKTVNLGLARELLFRHSPDVTYHEWVEAGMSLHHETKGSIDGLNLWDEWSARSEKYKGRADLENHWRSFKDGDNPRTLNSLRTDQAATEDEFEAVKPEEVAKLILASPPLVPITAGDVKRLLKCDKSGYAMPILPNVITVLSAPNVYPHRLAYDSFKDVLVSTPIGEIEWQPVTDTYYTATRLWLENVAKFNPVSREMVRDAIYYIAEVNKMDTAQLWLSTLIWDRTPRVRDFLSKYMGTINGKYEKSVSMYIWTALAGRIMQPGCAADMVPILIGNQGLGKSTGIAAMVPDPDYFVEIRLDEADDVIARKMRGVLIGEIAEMRGLRTQDLERIKSFVTRKHEKWVPKYQEFATTFARRCIMMGTSNEDDLFMDTENRRWLPVRTTGVDVDAIKRDRDQLWAEALQIWIEEGIHWQKAEELGKAEHEEFKATDAWSPIIEQWLKDNPATGLKLHDVLTQAVGMDVRHINRSHELRAASCLRSAGYEKRTVRAGDKVHKVWVRKDLDIAS